MTVTVHPADLEAERESLLAFAVTEAVGGEMVVLDLFGYLSPYLAIDLLDAAGSVALSTGAQTARIVLREDQDAGRAARRAGFWRRGDGPRVVAYTGSGAYTKALQSAGWWIRPVDLSA